MPGPQVPAFAVSSSPTAAVPEIVGTAVVSVPVAATTVAVAELSRLTVVYPVLAPVTTTVMVLPSASAGMVSVALVALVMLVPAAFHW